MDEGARLVKNKARIWERADAFQLDFDILVWDLKLSITSFTCYHDIIHHVFTYAMDEFMLRHHESLTMLDWYVGECMVSLVNINNGSIEPTHD